MNNNRLNYLAKRRTGISHKNLDIEILKKGSKESEDHHITSRTNSEFMIPLCKSCHEFVSDEQNSIPIVHRKNSFIIAFKSISGLLRLLAHQIDFIVERFIQNDKNSN